jgi:hypothetical protein
VWGGVARAAAFYGRVPRARVRPGAARHMWARRRPRTPPLPPSRGMRPCRARARPGSAARLSCGGPADSDDSARFQVRLSGGGSHGALSDWQAGCRGRR